MADSEDEDLKLAIALSLQQPQPSAGQNDALSQTNSTIQLKKGDNAIHSQSSAHRHSHSSTGNGEAPISPSSQFRLDHKAMEKERLARLRARLQQKSISPPPLTRELDRPKKIRKLDAERPMSLGGENGLPLSDSASVPVQYPNGIIRRTWALGHDRSNDIKIEEVLQPDTLRIAVLSAFQWDTDWLLTKIDASKTRFILVMQAKEEALQQQYVHETKDWPHVRLCFPPMPGQVSCMHSKLMLLFHGEHLRVAVPSANLVAYDWGETGVMENSVFLIDLPRLPEGRHIKKEELTSFGQELMYFVNAMGLWEDVKDGLLKFDFEKTRRLAFVHTIGGTHFSDEANRTGYLGLSRAVRALGIQTEGPTDVDFAASSIGSLNESFLKTIYKAAQGKEGVDTSKNGGGERSKSDFFTKPRVTKSRPPEDVQSRFRVYFPTEEAVRKSTGGPENGGTVCLQSKWYYATTFPKNIMRDYQSVRKGLLSHNKILYVRGQQQRQDNESKKPVAWAYVGSANMSESAWGKVVTDRATKQLKLTARNWECGVVVPVSLEGVGYSDEGLGMDVFKDTIGVPFAYPAQEYGERRPWFFMG